MSRQRILRTTFTAQDERAAPVRTLKHFSFSLWLRALLIIQTYPQQSTGTSDLLCQGRRQGILSLEASHSLSLNAGCTGISLTLVDRKKEGLIPFIERRAGLKFERIGAPQPADMAALAGGSLTANPETLRPQPQGK